MCVYVCVCFLQIARTGRTASSAAKPVTVSQEVCVTERRVSVSPSNSSRKSPTRSRPTRASISHEAPTPSICSLMSFTALGFDLFIYFCCNYGLSLVYVTSRGLLSSTLKKKVQPHPLSYFNICSVGF